MALGNTSSSALINGARSARNKQNAINDQYQAYSFNMSAQTPEDYQAYQQYLNGQMAKTVDPSKKLTYQTKLQSANTSFTGNEIQRQTDSVMTGQSDNSTKLQKIHDLWQQASASGNANLAQNLASQYISLSKTIQNEAVAAQGKAEASASKQMSSNKDQYDYVHQALKAQLAALQDEVRHGQASSTDLQKFTASYNAQTEAIMQDALQGKYGPLSDSTLGTISSDHNTLIHSNDYQRAIAEGGVYKDAKGKETANPNTFMKWDNVNGQWFATPVNRETNAVSGTKNTMVQAADGTWHTQFGDKWQGMDAAARAKAAKDGNFMYITNDGTSGHAGNNGYKVQMDANGNAFYIDPRPGANQNKPRYLSLDPNAKVQESDDPNAVTAQAGRAGRGWNINDLGGAAADALKAGNINEFATAMGGMKGNGKDPFGVAMLNPGKWHDGGVQKIAGDVSKGLFDRLNGHTQEMQNQRIAQAQAMVAASHANELKALQARTVGSTMAGAPGVPAALQPTPQQKAANYVQTMNTAPAPTAAMPKPLPVVNMINQAFAKPSAPAPAPAPKPQGQWWNPFSWGK